MELEINPHKQKMFDCVTSILISLGSTARVNEMSNFLKSSETSYRGAHFYKCSVLLARRVSINIKNAFNQKYKSASLLNISNARFSELLRIKTQIMRLPNYLGYLIVNDKRMHFILIEGTLHGSSEIEFFDDYHKYNSMSGNGLRMNAQMSFKDFFTLYKDSKSRSMYDRPSWRGYRNNFNPLVTISLTMYHWKINAKRKYRTKSARKTYAL